MKNLSLKSRRIIIVVIALAILALVGYGVYVAVSRSMLPQFTDGSELSTITIYGSNGGTNEWNFTIEDTTVAEVIDKKSDFEHSNGSSDSGTPVLYYTIQGKKAGRTKITFRFGSFTTGETIEEHTYLIEVNEKLENKVTEQK